MLKQVFLYLLGVFAIVVPLGELAVGGQLETEKRELDAWIADLNSIASQESDPQAKIRSINLRTQSFGYRAQERYRSFLIQRPPVEFERFQENEENFLNAYGELMLKHGFGRGRFSECLAISVLRGDSSSFQRQLSVIENDIRLIAEPIGPVAYNVVYMSMSGALRIPEEIDLAMIDIIWGSSCAGYYGNPIAGGSSEIGTPDFHIDVVGERVTVSGYISDGFLKRFRKAIDNNNQLRVVSFIGVGGDAVDDALKVGEIIAQRNLTTMVSGRCESACALAFLGGFIKMIDVGTDKGIGPVHLGFHRLTVPGSGRAIPDESSHYETIREYAFGVGVDGDAVVSFMTRGRQNEFYYPTVKELCLATILGFSGQMGTYARKKGLGDRCNKDFSRMSKVVNPR